MNLVFRSAAFDHSVDLITGPIKRYVGFGSCQKICRF